MLEAVRCALEELITTHQKNPLDLLYESDLQAFLFMRLRQTIRQTISIKPGILSPDSFANDQIITSLVHTEYPSSRKFDVAVIDPGLVQSTAQYQEEFGVELKNESVWGQRVQVALEIKQVRIGWDLTKGLQQLGQDLEKLQNYIPYYRTALGSSGFIGVALLFIQSFSEKMLEQIKRQHIFQAVEEPVEIAEGVSGYIITPARCLRVVPKGHPEETL